MINRSFQYQRGNRRHKRSTDIYKDTFKLNIPRLHNYVTCRFWFSVLSDNAFVSSFLRKFLSFSVFCWAFVGFYTADKEFASLIILEFKNLNVLEEFHYIVCFVEEFQQTHSVGTYISISSGLLSQTETTKQTTQSLKPQILHLIAQSKWFETNLSGNRNTYT